MSEHTLSSEIDEVLEDIEFDDFRTRTPSRCANILRGYIIAQAQEISELRKGANCPVYGSEDSCVYAEQLEAYKTEHEAVGKVIVDPEEPIIDLLKIPHLVNIHYNIEIGKYK